MRKKINFAGLTFSMTGALLLCLAINVQATTIPVRISDRVTPLANPSSSLQNPAGRTTRLAATLVLPMSVQVLDANTHSGPGSFSRYGQSVLTMPARTVSYVPAQFGFRNNRPVRGVPVVKKPVLANSVPDGGSTGILLGGVFGGLAILRRRLKPKQFS